MYSSSHRGDEAEHPVCFFQVKYPALYATAEECKNEASGQQTISTDRPYMLWYASLTGSLAAVNQCLHSCMQDDRKKFNCTQRGHQNSLENQPIFLSLLLTAGLRFPVTAAIAGASYLIGRVIYMESYATGDPAARFR